MIVVGDLPLAGQKVRHVADVAPAAAVVIIGNSFGNAFAASRTAR